MVSIYATSTSGNIQLRQDQILFAKPSEIFFVFKGEEDIS